MLKFFSGFVSGVVFIFIVGFFYNESYIQDSEVVTGQNTEDLIAETYKSNEQVIKENSENKGDNESKDSTDDKESNESTEDNVSTVAKVYLDFMLTYSPAKTQDLTSLNDQEKVELLQEYKNAYDISIFLNTDSLTTEQQLEIYHRLYFFKSDSNEQEHFEKFSIKNSDIELKDNDTSAFISSSSIKVSGTNSSGKKVIDKPLPNFPDLELSLTSSGWKINADTFLS